MRSPKWLIVIPVLAIASLAIAAAPALAKNPAYDSQCWPESQCRGQTAGDFRVDFEASDDCGGGWGRCYPASPISLQVKIPSISGLVGEVTSISEYIALFYRYGIIIATIIAVIAIMIGGLLWLTSAGAERLAAAKKWIGNAIIGLLLVLLSYTILQTINPDLVRLRLPRIMMIRPLALGSQFCANLADNIIATNGTPAFSTQEGGPYTLIGKSAITDRQCNDRLYPDPLSTTSRVCIATGCLREQVCIPTDADKYECKKGFFGGSIDYTNNAFIDDMRLMMACADGSAQEIAGVDVAEGGDDVGVQSFAMVGTVTGTLLAAGTACGGAANQLGLFLKIEVNDESRHLYTAGIAAGIDDWFAIGKSSCGGSSQPLRAKGKDGKETLDPDEFSSWATLAGSYWRVEEIIPTARGGAIGRVEPCKLSINRSSFPDR